MHQIGSVWPDATGDKEISISTKQQLTGAYTNITWLEIGCSMLPVHRAEITVAWAYNT